MLRTILAAVTVLSALAVSVGFVNDAPAGDRGVSELEFAVQTADGERLQAHFLVAADDSEEAARAAHAAIDAIHPGAEVLQSDHGDDGEHGDTTSGSRALGDEDDAPVNGQWGSWGWSWETAELPVTVAYNPAGALNGFTEGDFVAALETWSNVEGSSFAFQYAGQTDRDASMNTDGEDGANVVAWQDLGCDGGCVLGLTTKSFGQHEVDISLNTNPGARLDEGTYDISTVLIHELGHMAGLEHSCPALGPCTDAEAEAVMFYSYSGVRRDLTSDDVEGLVETYPGGATSGIPIDDGTVARPVEEDEGQDEQPAVEVTLQSGWNLQTLPTGVIEDALAELECVNAVYAYDHGSGWSHWVRGLDSSLQTLRQSSSSNAYWFLASSSCSASLR